MRTFRKCDDSSQTPLPFFLHIVESCFPRSAFTYALNISVAECSEIYTAWRPGRKRFKRISFLITLDVTDDAAIVCVLRSDRVATLCVLLQQYSVKMPQLACVSSFDPSSSVTTLCVLCQQHSVKVQQLGYLSSFDQSAAVATLRVLCQQRSV